MENTKLFRLTLNRKILFSEIISTLNDKIDHLNTFARRLILKDRYLSELEKDSEIDNLDREVELLALYNDVLKTVVYHNDDVNLNNFIKYDYGWRNEWDIPIDLFNESIEHIISTLEFYQNETLKEEYISDYKEKINLLKDLKLFRSN